nr:MAG TPA: hypothetical protein [Caudoviricetes sp.]
MDMFMVIVADIVTLISLIYEMVLFRKYHTERTDGFDVFLILLMTLFGGIVFSGLAFLSVPITLLVLGCYYFIFKKKPSDVFKDITEWLKKEIQ